MVPAGLVYIVVEAYSYVLSRTYILPIGATGMAFFCSLEMEWKKIKKNNPKDQSEVDSAADKPTDS